MTMMFPDESGIEIEVEYEVDKELYSQNHGVCVENVLMTGSKRPYWFTEFLNDAAFDLIEQRVVNAVLHA